MARLRIGDDDFGDVSRHIAIQAPCRGILQLLPCRPITCPEPTELEPRVALQEPDEMLSDHPGSPKNADLYGFHMPCDSLSTSCRYKPTASISSDLDIRSSLV